MNEKRGFVRGGLDLAIEENEEMFLNEVEGEQAIECFESTSGYVFCKRLLVDPCGVKLSLVSHGDLRKIFICNCVRLTKAKNCRENCS
jgi:hypothetical protein